MMAYPGTAESGGEFGGDYVPRPPAGQHNPGMAELQGTVELAPTPDGRNQVSMAPHWAPEHYSFLCSDFEKLMVI